MPHSGATELTAQLSASQWFTPPSPMSAFTWCGFCSSIRPRCCQSVVFETRSRLNAALIPAYAKLDKLTREVRSILVWNGNCSNVEVKHFQVLRSWFCCVAVFLCYLPLVSRRADAVADDDGNSLKTLLTTVMGSVDESRLAPFPNHHTNSTGQGMKQEVTELPVLTKTEYGVCYPISKVIWTVGWLLVRAAPCLQNKAHRLHF